MNHVEVVATCTERPLFLEVASSAVVCRSSVNLPCLDIDKAMQSVPELRFPRDTLSFTPEQSRLWAWLRFRLANKLTVLGVEGLHVRGTDPCLESLLKLLAVAGKHSDVTAALVSCTSLCEVDYGRSVPISNAADMLMGGQVFRWL